MHNPPPPKKKKWKKERKRGRSVKFLTVPPKWFQDGAECFLDIGDNNEIREYSSIHRSSKEDDRTVRTMALLHIPKPFFWLTYIGIISCTFLQVIGHNNLIMGSCHIAHDCKIGSNNILANNTLLAGHVVVEVMITSVEIFGLLFLSCIYYFHWKIHFSFMDCLKCRIMYTLLVPRLFISTATLAHFVSLAVALWYVLLMHCTTLILVHPNHLYLFFGITYWKFSVYGIA